MKRAVLTFIVAASFPLLSCASTQGSSENNVLVATQRLQGRWRLRSFVPETPFEAPLQGLLNAQLGAMTLTFQGSNYRADGTAINISGRFQILSSENELLSATLYDSTGVPFRISGQFSGPIFEFRSFDSPWRGTGSLERL